MNVQILGVDPANRGAGLMFEAIRQQLDSRYPGVNYVMSTEVRPADRLKLGAWGIFPPGKRLKDRLVGKVANALPSSFLRRAALIKDQDVDVVLDASGFAYGEFWGPKKMADRIADPIVAWKRQGKKVILMPQAWGAFEDPGFRPLLTTIFDHADMVFARDEVSFGHLKSIVGERTNLALAPDFTNLVKADLPSRLAPYAGRTLIVPNAKIIQAKGAAIEDRYLGFLAASVRIAQAAGQDPVLLVHEGAGDLAIAHKVNALLAAPVPVVSDLTALETKALIAKAAALVSSRFHGLVSGLAAGVPSLACGWSHKYQELLKDYQCAEHVVDLSAEGELDGKIEAFFQAALAGPLKQRIEAAGQAQKERSVEMWNKVFGVLDQASRT